MLYLKDIELLLLRENITLPAINVRLDIPRGVPLQLTRYQYRYLSKVSDRYPYLPISIFRCRYRIE